MTDQQADVTDLRPAPSGQVKNGRVPLLARLALSSRFHALAERLPLLRRHSRAEGRALFDIVSGFVQSQALLALVELRVLHHLAKASQTTADLARTTGVPEPRLAILLQSGAALRLVRRKGLFWQITPRGAAFLTVPGLQAMVRHHPVLYRDLADPVAFFRGETDPELATFWPYVFGPMAQADASLFQRYSRLMADSQRLVAEDTLRLADLTGVRRLMDIGGGTGAFLRHVGARYPGMELTLFDLPDVLDGAERFSEKLLLHPGSFRSDPLPLGADAISLIRVLYDHPDEVVIPLLAKIHDALPPGGRILVSEPMSGGDRPDPATDVYFAIYTLAMRTGRTRSAAEISRLLENAGFTMISAPKTLRSFITSVVEARRN